MKTTIMDSMSLGTEQKRNDELEFFRNVNPYFDKHQPDEENPCRQRQLAEPTEAAAGEGQEEEQTPQKGQG